MYARDIDRAEVDGRLHHDALEEVVPLLRFHDRSNRDPFRIDAVDAGGEDGVARLDVREGGDVVHLRSAGAVAAHDALTARPLDERADRAVAVGDELHFGHVLRRQDDAADEAIRVDDRVVCESFSFMKRSIPTTSAGWRRATGSSGGRSGGAGTR